MQITARTAAATLVASLLCAAPLLAQPRLTMDWEAMAEQLVTLGGTVTGGYVRWNFFTDTTVTVGGEVWVRDGQLVR